MSTQKLLREDKGGWEVDLRVGIRTRISLGRIRARGQASISHSRESSLYHSSPLLLLIYIVVLSLCLSRNILHTAGGRLSSISHGMNSDFRDIVRLV